MCGFRSCFEMVPEFYCVEFSRQFRLRKREHSSSYVTDNSFLVTEKTFYCEKNQIMLAYASVFVFWDVNNLLLQ